MGQRRASFQDDAAEIKVRAEIRAGEILAEMEKHPAGRPSKNRSKPATDLPPRLEDIGITKDDSHRWQSMAKVPEKKREEYIATG